MSEIWVKDPLDTSWYEFDWSSFLAAGETITSHTTGVDANLTKVSDSATATAVLIQVSGGTDDTKSVVTCNIHTTASNIYETEKTIYLINRQS